jgi:allantoin racemase
MKVIIINPNSDPDMTAVIQQSAEKFAGSQFEVTTARTPGAPEFIETSEDQAKAAPGMIQLVRQNADKCDAFVVACHCDPNLDTLKEITDKPVVGIGEASMKIASMLGHRFAVISTSRHSIPGKEALLRKYHLDGLGVVRAPRESQEEASEEEKCLQAARTAIKNDMAEVVVLGCAGLAGLDKSLQEKLAVPVLDGVACALIVASGLVRYGASTSKIRRYNPMCS